jgi:AcrR family transcriptional regulator
MIWPETETAVFEQARKLMAATHDRPGDEPKPQRIRKSERRKQLLRFGVEVFATVGYAATTMEAIAEGAGVTVALLTRYFDSKDAILLAILADIRAVSLDRWESELAVLGDPLARLHALADLFLTMATEFELVFQLLLRLLIDGADDPARGALRAYFLDMETLLSGIIAEGQQSGVFRRSLDPRVGAWQLIQTAIGYKMTHPLAAPVYQEPDYHSRAVDCLLDCLIKTDV